MISTSSDVSEPITRAMNTLQWHFSHSLGDAAHLAHVLALHIMSSGGTLVVEYF